MNFAIPLESEAPTAIPKDTQAAFDLSYQGKTVAKPKYRFLPKTHTHPTTCSHAYKGLCFEYVLFNLL